MSTKKINDSFTGSTDAVDGLSISRNFVKSSLVLMVNIGIRYFLQIGYLFLMTRMIGPDIFGVVALAAPVMSFLTLFSVNATGFLTLQKTDLSRDDVDNHFWASMGFSVILYAIALLFTPLFAWFYHDSRLHSIIPLLGIMFLLNPFIVQGRAILGRHLSFNFITSFETIALLVSYCMSTAVTWKFRNQYGLVAQQLIMTIILAILLIVKTRWIPRLPRQIIRLEKRDMSFVRNITIAKVAQFLNANIDKLLMGRMYGVEQLGFYNNALKLNTIPIRQIRIPFSSFVIPSMIRCATVEEKMTFFFNSVTIMMLITSPLIVFFVTFAEKIVLTVMGGAWIECVYILQIMGLYAFVTCLLPPFEWYLISMKKDKKQRQINVVSTIINCIVLVVLSRYPFRWFLMGYSLSSVATLAVYLLFMRKNQEVNVIRLIGVVVPILLISAGVAVLVHLISLRINLNVVAISVAFGLLYTIAIVLIPRYRSILRSMIQK